MPLACARGAMQLDRFLDHGGQREGPRLQIELAGFDLGKVEDFLDQRQQRFARGLCRLGISELLRRQRCVEQQIGHAEHAVERRANLVTDHREEARLGAIGGFRLVARLRERMLGLDAIGDVAADALYFAAVFAAYRRLRAMRSSARLTTGNFLVMHTRAVGLHGRRALLENTATRWCCRSSPRVVLPASAQ